MVFKVGETVVYPHHGAALIEAIETRTIKGEERKYLVLKVNTDALSELADRYTIRSIPTMAVFAGGREVTRTAGARPAADIETFIANTVQAQPQA